MGAEVPDWVAVSVGDGCTLAGIWKGLQRDARARVHPRACRGCSACRRQGARPLVDAFQRGRRPRAPGPRRRIADSICVGHPRNWRKALRAVRESGGAFVAVPDDAILEAMREAGRRAGVFGEPAGVAGLAGLRQAAADGLVGRGQTALAVVTGSGLKDVRTAIRAGGRAGRSSAGRRRPRRPPGRASRLVRRSGDQNRPLDAAARRDPGHARPAGGGRGRPPDRRRSHRRARPRRCAPHPDEEVLDLEGALVMPGLVNAHTHLYSALARGMPGPAAHPRTFREILERVWWRLDRALDEETVALVRASWAPIEAALSGTTVLIDHHSSPSFIRGSLADVKRAIESVGLRSVLCYEVTDRNGTEGRDLGVEENVAFQRHDQTALTRGMIGGHASFTLSDESLDRLAPAVRETGSSVHVHVAEDRADVDGRARPLPVSRCRTGWSATACIGARTLLAHCVHLQPEEVQDVHVEGRLDRAQPALEHEQHRGLRAGGGHAPGRPGHRRHGRGHAGGGAGGLPQDARGRAARTPTAAALELLAGGHRLAAALFGLPFGKLDAGGPADLVVLDYRPPTPLTSDNLAGHLLFGLDRSHVRSVMVAGPVRRDRPARDRRRRPCRARAGARGGAPAVAADARDRQ